ncbi:MAG TPA: helix-hairpin-helix domain-containing protein [Bryobacteraceae bacterium]|nr:helix-hairpin-helix domain-containing protein [Bryobacteraceae bacterium]
MSRPLATDSLPRCESAFIQPASVAYLKTAFVRVLGPFCIAFVLLVGVAQAELPAGPGKDVTLRVCGKCHSPELATSLHQNESGWAATISKMVDMGAKGTDDEFNAILAYLVKNFGPQAPPPVNVNKATAVDLESSLLLLRSEATAIIQYRSEKGNFKTIDDLRNVPGLDFKKIEAKKDRIVF